MQVSLLTMRQTTQKLRVMTTARGASAEIRGLALLLASDASSFMTGGVYLADGGQMLMSPPLPPARRSTPRAGGSRSA
jgi:hypothetical protein